jgi:hypothetical protein
VHDVLTNNRGKILEELIISKQLHITNEESSSYAFQTERGASNIDLTVLNTQAIDYVKDWAIHEQESFSDHKIIKYEIGKGKNLGQPTGPNKVGKRYRVTQEGTETFQRTFVQRMEQLLYGPNKVKAGLEELDEDLSQRVRKAQNTEEVIEEFQEVLDKACKSSYRLNRTTKKETHHKRFAWWTQSLTILRKKFNVQRRRFQRTKGNNVLREQRKEQCLTTNAEYTATIRKERLSSWKKYCTMTSATNPWNGIYKLVAGRRKQTAPITTLRQKDGKLTANLHETLQYMIQEFTPGDNPDNDNATHKQLRAATQEPIDTADDKEISVQEVKNVVTSMGGKKAPGEDGIPSKVYKGLVEILPRYLTAFYNKCLKTRIFPKRWKKAVILPIIKPGQEGSDEISKFRPKNYRTQEGRCWKR